MVKNRCLVFLFIFFFAKSFSQINSYKDSIITYQNNYITTHEVVKGEDHKYISFYPVDTKYKVVATFKKIFNNNSFEMNTSSGSRKKYIKYGIVSFMLHDSLQHLYIYQSVDLMQQPKYKNYLFIPFGDVTSGFTSYGGGRYLDFTVDEIKGNKLLIDFNKAYNPYCAYTSGYNCPIPPAENILSTRIFAGEKNYGKPLH